MARMRDGGLTGSLLSRMEAEGSSPFLVASHRGPSNFPSLTPELREWVPPNTCLGIARVHEISAHFYSVWKPNRSLS